MNDDNDQTSDGSWIALEAITRNVTALLFLSGANMGPHGSSSNSFELAAPVAEHLESTAGALRDGAQASVTTGSISARRRRDEHKTPPETELAAPVAVTGGVVATDALAQGEDQPCGGKLRIMLTPEVDRARSGADAAELRACRSDGMKRV